MYATEFEGGSHSYFIEEYVLPFFEDANIIGKAYVDEGGKFVDHLG